MGMFSIQVRTPEGELVTIPNAVAVAQSITNFTRVSQSGDMSLSTEVTIGYTTPWRQVRALLELAAARTAGVLRDPPPRVFQQALQDFYIRYRLTVALEGPANRAATLDRLLASIQDAFNEHGVQILSPNYEADPERPAIIPPERWYAAPAVAPPASTPGAPSSDTRA
jgi:small-conductance mechanosensitive channel